MTAVPVDVWDLRHLLLSLDDRSRDDPDGEDLEGVVARALATLALAPPRPAVSVPRTWRGRTVVEGLPLWIMETNAWLLAPQGPGGDCIVVDVPPSPGALIERITALELRLVAVVLTHAHVDHSGGTGSLLHALAASVPVYVHPADLDVVGHPERTGVLARVAHDVCPPPSDALVPLGDGAMCQVGGLTVRALHTPGHTPGSTCLLVEGGPRPLLFSGDTLFAGRTGRCDLPGSSRSLADASLRSLIAPLPDDTVVLPGHGGLTTMARERRGQLAFPSLAA